MVSGFRFRVSGVRIQITEVGSGNAEVGKKENEKLRRWEGEANSEFGRRKGIAKSKGQRTEDR